MESVAILPQWVDLTVPNANDDALQHVHGHPSPSQGSQSPPALRQEVPTEVRARRRRRLGIARLRAESADGRIGRSAGRRDAKSSQDGAVRLDKVARRDAATPRATQREVKLPSVARGLMLEEGAELPDLWTPRLWQTLCEHWISQECW